MLLRELLFAGARFDLFDLICTESSTEGVICNANPTGNFCLVSFNVKFVSVVGFQTSRLDRK